MPNHILIVDDNQIMRRALRDLLSGDGNAVCEEAANGLEAIEIARTFHPDFVVLDFSMPLMNGLETAQQLKRMMPHPHIVMLTLFKDKYLEAAAHKAGITWVFSKAEDEVSRVRDFARILLRPDARQPSQE